MPREPILQIIDWPNVYNSGMEYKEWLECAEGTESREEVEARRGALTFEAKALDFLRGLERRIYVVAIAEAWCGDVRRHVPVLARMEELCPALAVRYILLDQHPSVLVRFLTNGGEAIPKFIFLNDQFVECGNWGPMPETCKILIARGKACGDLGAARRKVSELYEADPGCRQVILELLALLEIAASGRP